MRSHNAVALSALAAGAVHASTSPGNGNGVVQWDIQRTQRREEFRRLGRRDGGTFEEVVTNEQARGGYFATCRLGTPGQDLTLQLDTGSSDIWVPDSEAQVCRQAGTEGCSLGTCKI